MSSANCLPCRVISCGPFVWALSTTSLAFAFTPQYPSSPSHTPKNDQHSHFSLYCSPYFFASIFRVCRAWHFIAGVPSHRNRSTSASASSRNVASRRANVPNPSMAGQRTTLLSSSASSGITRAARIRCVGVCATRGTTSPKCHRVRTSSTGSDSRSPANSSANFSSKPGSRSVTRRAVSTARFLTATSSPNNLRTRARTSALSWPISPAY